MPGKREAVSAAGTRAGSDLKADFTYEELQAELDQIGALVGMGDIVEDSKAVTAAQFAARYGMTPNSAADRLKKFTAAGQLEQIIVYRPCENGQKRRCLAYRIPKRGGEKDVQ